MKIKNITERERDNPTLVTVYKEGLFYRVYNESAIWWTKNVKDIKLHKKYIKYIDRYILYGGFPANAKETVEEIILKKGKIVNDNENVIEIESDYKPGNDELTDWLNTISDSKLGKTKMNTDDIKSSGEFLEIIETIRNFQVGHKTPFEAMQLIVDLQKKLQ